jgi:hypothetical protein
MSFQKINAVRGLGVIDRFRFAFLLVDEAF